MSSYPHRTSIEDHAARGYERESEPYRRIMRECATGTPMSHKEVPFRKLGPTMWVILGLTIGMCFGMVLGAGAKHCPPSTTTTGAP